MNQSRVAKMNAMVESIRPFTVRAMLRDCHFRGCIQSNRLLQDRGGGSCPILQAAASRLPIGDFTTCAISNGSLRPPTSYIQ